MIYTPDLKTALLTGTAMGLITAYMAFRKGKNPLAWFLIGLFFGYFGILAFFFIPKAKKKQSQALMKQTISLPEPYLFGPSDKFWYYVDETRKQVGPLSHNSISKIWKEGKLPPSTFIWHEDLSEWTPLKELVRIQEQIDILKNKTEAF